MLPKVPIDFNKVKKEDLDKEILRAAIISELNTIDLYEQLAEMTRNKNIRMTLLEVIRGKRIHMGEFQAHLMEVEQGLGSILDGNIKPVDSTPKR